MAIVLADADVPPSPPSPPPVATLSQILAATQVLPDTTGNLFGSDGDSPDKVAAEDNLEDEDSGDAAVRKIIDDAEMRHHPNRGASRSQKKP